MNLRTLAYMGETMNREKWQKSLKLALACVIAIALAQLLGLKYATTAGIITILSIQNTKKETLQIAGRRAAAFVCALLSAAVFFFVFGFTIPAFAGYLFCFSAICLYLGWPEAISMCSVLISHFLAEQDMGMAALVNESLLFVIGAGMGILANMHLRRKRDEFDRLAQEADEAMCNTLKAVTHQLANETGEKTAAAAQDSLEAALQRLQYCAHQNWNNTLFAASSYETDYADMRSGQAQVLKHISESAGMLEVIPRQAAIVADLLARVEQEYERKNTVEGLLDDLQQVYADMRLEPLPVSREEFEARAVLFYVLKQVEAFLLLKRKFVLVHKNK